MHFGLEMRGGLTRHSSQTKQHEEASSDLLLAQQWQKSDVEGRSDAEEDH